MGCGGSKESTSVDQVDVNVRANEKPLPTSKVDKPPPAQKAASTVGRRAGVSAETGEDDVRAIKVKRASSAGPPPKTEEEIKAIRDAVAGSPLFEGLSQQQMDEVVGDMFECDFKAGQTVIKQREKGDNFYVVQSGAFAAYLEQVGDKPVKEYTAGTVNVSFGELALMYNTPRAATVKCTADGRLWALDRSTFRGILMAANKEAIDSTASFLKSVSLLSPLTDAQRDALSNVLEPLTFGPKETIVREGELADALYLIREGKVAAYKSADGKEQGKLLGEMGQQQFFGESALEGKGEVRQATVVSVTAVKMLRLTQAHFSELFGNLADVLKFNFNQKVLGTMEMFRDLTPSEKDALVDSLEEMEFEEGAEIVKQGTTGTTFYIIKSGSVTVTAIDGEGNKKVIKDKLGPSEYFGEMALLNSTPRMATISATSHTICMTLDRQTFQRLLGEGHDIVQREAENRKRELDRAQAPPILMKDLKPLKILGVGTFGRVKLVLHTTDNNRPYALKCMRKGQVVALKQVEHVMNEKTLLEQCNHPFLLRLASTFQDEDELYMLMELALGGELFSILRERVRFDEKQSCFYAACVQSAFAYLHDRSIVYRDLKPENLLFDSEGYLKVVDFGFAKKIVDRTWTLCGTPEYLAPEIITNKGHSLPVDWWAFGILIYECLNGQPPFCADDPMEIYQKILRNKLQFPPLFSKTSRDLISKLLVTNPSQRLGSLKKGHRDISGHAFFGKTSFKDMLKKKVAAPYVPKISSPTDTSNFDDYDEEDGEDWSRFNDKRTNLFQGF